VRALLSVADREGIASFARRLQGLGIELVATDGTRDALAAEGVDVGSVSDLTQVPPLVGGQVKTFHPAVYAGILARRDVPEQLAELEAQGIGPIDLVVVNVKPFAPAVGARLVPIDEAIELIDVGGAALLGAAARNAAGVTAVSAPDQYDLVADEIKERGMVSAETRARLAAEAFSTVAAYHAEIAAYLNQIAGNQFPRRLALVLEKVDDLRYGENPHQTAAFYRVAGAPPVGLAAMTPLHGPELGYNNVLDFSAALGLLLEFDEPAAVVIKHTNPCGAARAATVGAAMALAKASDPVSIYGGIVGVNRTLDAAVVEALAGVFVEILFAPAFAPDALDEIKRTKKKCRVFEVSCDRALPARLAEYRGVLGGLLVQTTDLADLERASIKTVSRRAPTPAELDALRFAWRVGKHAKSNAIVLTTRDQVIGVGAGQMNRVDSARLAVMRAREIGLETAGTVCASDAFFPFRDGLDVVARSGATAVIQPGGSLRDEEVIAAADEQGLAMVFTGMRHFRH
jgi:phosphoribosylaminoimidazolecarboxamide formyltransferase/IMP cyclohydrolase